MKFRIEIDDNCTESEIVIRCKELNDEVATFQKAFSKVNVISQQITLYKNDTEFFMPISNVLFFETEEKNVKVHTADDVYDTKMKLYEIENMYSQTFMRVSKSSIVNVGKIYSITKTLSNCCVQFAGSVKQVYVSRMYYKDLRDRLDEKK